jgi:hypothetical protein
MTEVSLGRPDCFFRAKSEKASLWQAQLSRTANQRSAEGKGAG